MQVSYKYGTSVNLTLIVSLIPSIFCYYSEFRKAEDKSAIFGSQKPHRADNMLHNTKSTAQISQQLRTASFLSSSRTDRERWCVRERKRTNEDTGVKKRKRM